MVVTNPIIVPALMVFALEIFEVSPAYSAGLIIFAVAAGAPFLIKLKPLSEHDMAFGASPRRTRCWRARGRLARHPVFMPP